MSIQVEKITAETTPPASTTTPTVVEKLSAQRHYVVNDTVDPGERDWFKAPKGVVFIKGFRSFKNSNQGRRSDAHGQDAVYIDIPNVIPLDQIQDLVKHLLTLEKLGREQIATL